MEEKKQPTGAEEHNTPEAPVADGPGTTPAQPAPGDVVVPFEKIEELMAEQRAAARHAVEQAEPLTPEAPTPSQPEKATEQAPEEKPQEEVAAEQKKPRRGRPPKAEKTEQAAPKADKEQTAAKPRRDRPPKADKAAPDEAQPPKPRDKVSQGIIMLAPIFSGEYEGVDNIILTSKYGKTKCATAKVVAGIITAILTTTLIAAFNLLLAFVFYGTEGLDCSILFAPSDYVEAFIPFNITCGTLLKYQILLAFTCTLSVTGITLFLSAISKNQIVALVAAMAIFLFPVLLPITEVNPLFRLVGLLPIYHVLAISLLSVEQMSNGMLYAIWAIPAALLFLGVGAGISRRVFAKHQVL